MDSRQRLESSLDHREPDRITFWGGFDQQQVLPFGTPEQVREEARRLLDAMLEC